MEIVPRQQKFRMKRTLLFVCLLLVLPGIGCAIYLGSYYRATDEAVRALSSPPEDVSIEILPGQHIAFIPQEPVSGLIFYPGGKVQYESYAPLMEQCAQRRILCVLIHMPGNLAVLNPRAADGICGLYPEIKHWFIGGHSLGGAMAASYAADHVEEYEGLVLLAAYAVDDHSDSGLEVLSVFGTQDGVLDTRKYDEARRNLPEGFSELVIDGGCHAYFGSYGEQNGDGTPTISNAEQIEQTADAIAAMAIAR